MRFIGNLLWLVLGGIVAAILWMVTGLLLCVTIIGVPFGVQCFKIAGFILWPFGRDVEPGHFGVFGALGNILWIVLVGIELCLLHAVSGLLLCVTIIGIPLALQHFKLCKIALVPFGAKIVRL